MKKEITREEREKISNRLVLNFGILLCGALVMLYIYNFVNANYIKQTATAVGIIGIIALIATVVFFILSKKKDGKFKTVSAISLGAFVCALITYIPSLGFVKNLLPAFTMKTAIISVFILMLVYFVVMCVVTMVTLAIHPLAPVQKNKIQHAKGKKKKKK